MNTKEDQKQKRNSSPQFADQECLPWSQCYLMAGNPDLALSLIEEFARDCNYRIRLRIAENPCTPELLLMELAKDNHPEVRMAVADNPQTPVEILEHLAGDESADVRYGLAENCRLPFSILLQLLHDDNPYVSSRARMTAERVRSSSQSWCIYHEFASRRSGNLDRLRLKQEARMFMI
jgi:hypothetical protein